MRAASLVAPLRSRCVGRVRYDRSRVFFEFSCATLFVVFAVHQAAAGGGCECGREVTCPEATVREGGKKKWSHLPLVRAFGGSAAVDVDKNVEWSPEVHNATDAWEAQYYMKVDLLLSESLKIPKSEQAAFKQKYEISQGHWSLEWCHPSPVPFHTYEGNPVNCVKAGLFADASSVAELPIIKEIDEHH